MRISEINQNNYTEFMRLFSKTNPKAEKSFLSQSLSNLPQAQVSSTNPYAAPGQDVTGRTDWKKIVPVSKEVTDKLSANVKEDFEERNGMTGKYNNQNDIINDYLQTLPPEERSSASWTLDQVIINESSKLADKIKQYDPNWNYGQSFDTSILDEKSSDSHLDQKG